MTFVIVKLSNCQIVTWSDCRFWLFPPLLLSPLSRITTWKGTNIYMSQVNRRTYIYDTGEQPEKMNIYVTCHIRLDDENHLWQFCRLPHSRIIHPARVVHLFLNFCKECFLYDNDNCVHALSRKYQNMLYSCLILYIVYRIYIEDIEKDDKIFKPVWCRIWKHSFWAPHSPPCFYIWLTFVLQGLCFHIWLLVNAFYEYRPPCFYIWCRLLSSLLMW